jgi:hypothetical protein
MELKNENAYKGGYGITKRGEKIELVRKANTAGNWRIQIRRIRLLDFAGTASGEGNLSPRSHSTVSCPGI